MLECMLGRWGAVRWCSGASEAAADPVNYVVLDDARCIFRPETEKLD